MLLPCLLQKYILEETNFPCYIYANIYNNFYRLSEIVETGIQKNTHYLQKLQRII